MPSLPPIHPGEILWFEFMQPTKRTKSSLAQEIGVAPNRVGQIINGQRAISAETALLLAEVFATTPEFWMNLQSAYELELAKALRAALRAKKRAPLTRTSGARRHRAALVLA